MIFNTKYNQAQKYVPKIESGKRADSMQDEAQYVTANMKRTLLRLENRDLFVEKMDRIEECGKKCYIGRISRG